MFLAAASPGAAEVALARVDGLAITGDDLAARVAASRGAGSQARAAELLEDLINDSLLAADARRAGLDKDPKVTAAMEAERRRLAAQAFQAGEVQEAMTVDEEQLRKMYRSGADQARLYVIHLATKEEAAACLDRLQKGAKFEAEAAKGLNTEVRARGGELGWRSRAQMEKPLEESVFAAKVGEPFGPVALDLGFAVVKVAERRLGDEAGFAEKKDELTRFAQLQARQQTKTHLQLQKRKEAKAQVDLEFLKSTGTAIEASVKDAERVVVSAGAHKITYAQVLASVRSLSQGREGSHFSGLAVKQEMAWQLVDQRLFEDLAVDRGYGKDPKTARSLERFTRDALAQALAAKIRSGIAKPDEVELGAWYASHKEAFTHPSARRCAHILAPTESQAQAVFHKALKGDFATLAKDFSADQATAAKGGDLGEVNADILRNLAGAGEKVLADALASAPADQVTEPIKGTSGWHVVRCGKFTTIALTPFAQVRDAIERQIVMERGNAAIVQRFQELRGNARISIDRDALERVAASEL
jgi:parvulin-like peptidyl-prolyl isomerase